MSRTGTDLKSTCLIGIIEFNLYGMAITDIDYTSGIKSERQESALSRIFSFPETVNESAARTVAAGVVMLCALTLATQWHWLTLVLAYGFLARVLTGPTLSPLGQLATRVVVPTLGLPDSPTSGSPKRFAQGIGATLSSAAVAAWLLGASTVANALIAMILVAATLEAVLGFCLGCVIFGQLIRLGVVSESACVDCADITGRLNAAQSHR